MQENIQLYNMDCMELMKTLPDKWADLAVVDTPYGIGESSKNHASRNTPIKQANGTILKAPDAGYTRKDWDNAAPTQAYFDELFRVSKHQIIWGENYLTFSQKASSTGRIVWDKVNGESDFSDCEIAWTSLHDSVRQIEYMWAGMMQGKSLSEGRVMQGNKKLNEKRIHPTHKPVLLYKWLLKNYATPDMKILDTHGGSMSIAIALDDFGIKEAVICEIDEEYFQNGKARYEQHKRQYKLFD